LGKPTRRDECDLSFLAITLIPAKKMMAGIRVILSVLLKQWTLSPFESVL
jgi:hypothetical protein